MNKEIEFLIKDLKDTNLPRDIANYLKIKCNLNIGTKICWYYKDELEFWQEDKLEPRDHAQYKGVIVPKSDIEYRGGELDIEDCVVIQYREPCEKCYPTTVWFALKRLLDQDDLVEIFEIKK